MAVSSFDEYSNDYEAALQQGLSVSGESADYFAIGRVKWLRRRLAAILGDSFLLKSAMDFGCGTGNSVEYLLSELGLDHVIGIDTSEQSLVQARLRYPASKAQFLSSELYVPSGALDLAFCNGVFHHIPIALRSETVDYVYRSLKPGGWFSFWENNPWNPGTRIVMSRIPFDRDAVTLTIPESKRLLEDAGVVVKRIDTCFYFPRQLGWFRPMEPCLAWLPLGAQYLVLAQKVVVDSLPVENNGDAAHFGKM